MTYDLKTNIADAKTEYRAWNKAEKNQENMLYEILAKNLEIIENLKTDYDINNINTQLSNSKIRVNDKSSIELKVLRLIMTSESKKASVYAIVLTTARQEGIKSTNFVAWLKLKGGIEKLRNSTAVARLQADNSTQFDAGKKIVLQRNSLATVRLDISHTKKNDLVLLVGRVGDNNDLEIVEVAGVGENSDLLEKAVRNIEKTEGSKAGNANSLCNSGSNPLVRILNNTLAVPTSRGQPNV